MEEKQVKKNNFFKIYNIEMAFPTQTIYTK